VPDGLKRLESPAQHDDGVYQIVPERRMQVRHPARMVCVSLSLCMLLCMSCCMLMVCLHRTYTHIQMRALQNCMPCPSDACLVDLHALQTSMPLRSLITCNCPCLVAFLACPFSVFPCAVMADLSQIICVPPSQQCVFLCRGPPWCEFLAARPFSLGFSP
jgi:hypothetical protein